MADAVRVRLLGGFDASAGESTVPPSAWRLRKSKTLVKLLAVDPAHRMHRDRVVDALWPGADAGSARNNLHQVVHAARKALSTLGVNGADVLGWHDDLVVLGSGCEVVTDLEELESEVREAQRVGRRDLLVQVLHRTPGELLPEDVYEPWAQVHVTAFREWRTQLVMDLVESQLEADEADLAVSLLAPVVAAEPLNEPAQRAMMRALAALGRRSEALLAFERLRTVLRDELAAEPEQSTRELFRELLTGGGGRSEASVIPAPRSASNLPAPLTPLVGRRRELAETGEILDRTRLLTFTGMGGAGKTTLAVELARRRAADHPDGVHLVELESLSAGEQVAPRIARTVHLELPPDVDPVESLVAQLRRQQLLLVLDSCEHLLSACAQAVSELLRGCPGISVLATSREPLRIEGEVVWQTPSLELPDPAVGTAVDELASVASVELFVRRAAAAAPVFGLTEDNAAAVADICYRLDGIPLALELAAACIPVLTPQQIAARLGDSLSLLRRGDRATITRQQTLAATLAWSHDLLDDDERILFRRLAAFAGSFTIDAVEAVCGSGLAPGQVLGALARLVDTSFVVVDVRGDVTRYRLLETVRQYAAELLRAAGEQVELQRRHCDWYLQFALARDPELSPVGEVLPASLDAEHDNLRAAVTWALQRDPETAMRLSVALWRHWLVRGFFAEGRRCLEAVLAAVPEPTPLRARALFALAVFDIRRGRAERLAELGAEAVAIHRAQDGNGGLAHALHADAVLAFMRGSWDESWQRSRESCSAAAASGTDQIAVASTHLQALVLMGRGELAPAREALEEVRAGLAALERFAPPFFPPLMLGFSVEGARTGSPRLYFEETVLHGRQVAAEQAEGYVLCNLADVARLDGDLDGALGLLQDAVCRFAALRDHAGEGLALGRLGCLHRVRGEHSASGDALTQSLRLRRSLGDRRAIGLTEANLGLLVAAEGDFAAGSALLDQALAGFHESQDRAARIGLAITIASVHADAGRYDRAVRQLVEALHDAKHVPGNHRAVAWSYAMLGDLHLRLGRQADAERARAQAQELFRALGAVDGTAALLDLQSRE